MVPWILFISHNGAHITSEREAGCSSTDPSHDTRAGVFSGRLVLGSPMDHRSPPDFPVIRTSFKEIHSWRTLG